MTRGVVRNAGVVAVFVVVLALLWFTRRVLMLLFAGLLVALVLTSLTGLFRKIPRVGQKAGLAFSLLLLGGIVTGVLLLAVPAVSDQFGKLGEAIPKRLGELQERLEKTPTMQRIKQLAPKWTEFAPEGGAGRLTQFFSSAFESASSLVFIVFTGIFAAASPKLYREMTVKLFSPRLREKAGHTIDRAICTLKYWLLGQFISMTVVGIVTGVALAIAGVPFAAALGIVAAFAEFIPIIGPVIAAIPATLLAFSEGSDKGLIVIGIFVAIQFFESNILTPVVQKRAVDLPPVVTLVALLVFGGAFGLLGMFVAAPLAAVILVLVEEIYVRGYLGTDDRLLESS